MDIRLDVIGELADFVTPYARRTLLEPGGAGRIEELLEESDGLECHAGLLVSLWCRYGVYCRRKPVRYSNAPRIENMIKPTMVDVAKRPTW